MDWTIDAELINAELINAWLLSHKLLAAIIFIILVEIVYFIFVRTEKRNKDGSIMIFTIEWKLLSLILTIAGSIGLYGLIIISPILLISIGGVGIIGIYIGINYLVTKYFGKTESDKEYKERIRLEDKKYKFKVGDEVIIQSKRHKCMNGQKAKIEKREIDDGDKEYILCNYTKCDCDNYQSNSFLEESLRKVRKRK